jgi:pimeloyl-ACP methyl ester carboxylesterase
MPTSTLNAIPIHWERAGLAGEPVVLVHGSWIDHHTWDAVVPALAGEFRVLTFDRRGHSLSGRGSGRYAIAEEVGDVVALIEAHELAPAHVVGSSSGGSLALRLAAERPDLVRSLAVNEPALFDLLPADVARPVRAGLMAVAEKLAAGHTEEGVRDFVEKIAFGPGAWERIPPEVKATVLGNAPAFLDQARDPGFLGLDLASLRAYRGPAMLTRGEHGPAMYLPILDALAGALPQAERRVVEGADHEPEATQPQRYAAMLVDFFRRA